MMGVLTRFDRPVMLHHWPYESAAPSTTIGTMIIANTQIVPIRHGLDFGRDVMSSKAIGIGFLAIEVLQANKGCENSCPGASIQNQCVEPYFREIQMCLSCA
jgi:hypothetical protein